MKNKVRRSFLRPKCIWYNFISILDGSNIFRKPLNVTCKEMEGEDDLRMFQMI